MKKSKEELSQRITYLCRKNITDKNFIKENCDKLYKTHNIPYSMSNDILTMRTSPEDYEDVILFCILEAIKTSENNMFEFFTDVEINKYNSYEYKQAKYKLPIKWNMIQIAGDQWIGAITVSELMKLSKARLIRYNENTQRPLTRKTLNGEEYYAITINEVAVRAIQESFNNNTYIPNAITINMPETTDYEYIDGQLIIRDIDAFDILDGYHRYVAMQRICMEDSKFDYIMEFRVVSFREERARQFIWQEDQKTKMAKIDSDILNQNSIANQVIGDLNIRAPFTGKINNNKSTIDSAVLARFIDLYCIDKTKKLTNKDIAKLKNNIYSHMKMMAENDPEILDEHWKIEFLVAIFQTMYQNVEDEEFVDKALDLYNKLLLPENSQYVRNFKNKIFRKVDITRIEKLQGGE